MTVASPTAFAEADASKAAAKVRLEKGADLLVTHAYARALVEFQDAYNLFPSPKIFFDVGLANVGLARNADAIRAFQRFMTEAIDASPGTMARAKAQIDGLLPQVAVVDFACPAAGTEISVDDRSVGRAPLAGPQYLDPGSHRLVAKVNESAAPILKAFDVAAGTRVTVSVPIIATTAALAVPAAIGLGAASPGDVPPMIVDKREPTPPASSGERPLYGRPWFWAAAAGVVATGLILWLTVGHASTDPTPSLGQTTLPVSP